MPTVPLGRRLGNGLQSRAAAIASTHNIYIRCTDEELGRSIHLYKSSSYAQHYLDSRSTICPWSIHPSMSFTIYSRPNRSILYWMENWSGLRAQTHRHTQAHRRKEKMQMKLEFGLVFIAHRPSLIAPSILSCLPLCIEWSNAHPREICMARSQEIPAYFVGGEAGRLLCSIQHWRRIYWLAWGEVAFFGRDKRSRVSHMSHRFSLTLSLLSTESSTYDPGAYKIRDSILHMCVDHWKSRRGDGDKDPGQQYIVLLSECYGVRTRCYSQIPIIHGKRRGSSARRNFIYLWHLDREHPSLAEAREDSHKCMTRNRRRGILLCHKRLWLISSSLHQIENSCTHRPFTDVPIWMIPRTAPLIGYSIRMMTHVDFL